MCLCMYVCKLFQIALHLQIQFAILFLSSWYSLDRIPVVDVWIGIISWTSFFIYYEKGWTYTLSQDGELFQNFIGVFLESYVLLD